MRVMRALSCIAAVTMIACNPGTSTREAIPVDAKAQPIAPQTYSVEKRLPEHAFPGPFVGIGRPHPPRILGRVRDLERLRHSAVRRRATPVDTLNR